MAGLECHIVGMTEKHPKRPRDVNQLAKAIVDLGTMDEEERAALYAALKEQDKAPKKRPAKAETVAPRRHG